MVEKKKIDILLIEDNPGDIRLVKEILKQSNHFEYSFNTSTTLSEGLEIFLWKKIDIILLDLSLPDCDGLNTVSILKKKIGNVPIIILTGNTDDELAIKAVKEGIQDYIVKGELTLSLLERSIIYARERSQNEEILKISEENYRQAYQRANFYKDIFTHNMNNLLQGVLSASQLFEIHLQGISIQSGLRDVIEIIDDQISKGSNLILNIKRLTQVEENLLPIETIDFLNILREEIQSIKFIYKNKKVDITVISPYQKVLVLANDFLRSILQNLASNAIRFNYNPIIEITIKITEENIDSAKYFKIEFSDNGIGIEDEWKNEILYKGSKDEPLNRGIGLGLLLVRKIVESYHGEICVENRIKDDHTQGSNFVILIPRGEQ